MSKFKYPCTFVTGSAVLILVCSHLIRCWLTSWGYDGFCLNLAKMIQYQEWYRVITYGAVYSNFLHLVIVVVFLLPVGTLVEKRLGSIHFANILVVFTVLVPLIHLLLETMLLYFYSNLLYECFLGFSSVLFGIFVLEVCSAKQRWESILGSVSLSWWIVPWLSAILCEVITGDHVAFLGHISGLIVGHMYTMDILVFLKIPGTKIVMLEKSELLHSITKFPGFILYPSCELLPVSVHQKSNAGSKPKLFKKPSGDPTTSAANSHVQGQSQNQIQISQQGGSGSKSEKPAAQSQSQLVTQETPNTDTVSDFNTFSSTEN